MRSEYYTYIQENSVEGSGTAHSYVRALDMLGPILKNQTTTFAHHSDIWSIQIPATIEQLYEFILKEQRKKKQAFLADISLQAIGRVVITLPHWGAIKTFWSHINISNSTKTACGRFTKRQRAPHQNYRAN